MKGQIKIVVGGMYPDACKCSVHTKHSRLDEVGPLKFFAELVLARAEMQDGRSPSGRPLQPSSQQPELNALSPDSGVERTHL